MENNLLTSMFSDFGNSLTKLGNEMISMNDMDPTNLKIFVGIVLIIVPAMIVILKLLLNVEDYNQNKKDIEQQKTNSNSDYSDPLNEFSPFDSKSVSDSFDDSSHDDLDWLLKIFQEFFYCQNQFLEISSTKDLSQVLSTNQFFKT